MLKTIFKKTEIQCFVLDVHVLSACQWRSILQLT